MLRRGHNVLRRSRVDRGAAPGQWFKAPVIEDEKLDAAKRAHQARITPVTMGQRQIDEEARDALVEDRPVVAGASEPMPPTSASFGPPTPFSAWQA